MSANKRYVKSIASMQLCYNLVSTDQRGRKMSVILTRGDVSRALTEEEFKSPEIQNGLKARNLLDWTAKVSK